MRPYIPALFLLSFIASLQAKAQDANYGQSAYGPTGLLPGAAVANDHGRGFFYYNPALLAIDPKTSVSLSASIYQFESLKIRDGVGTGLDLDSRSFKINPQMVAGTIAFKKKKTIALGYALLHNPVISYSTTQRQDKLMQVLDDSYSPGPEYYIGQYTGYNRISITTGVLSAGIKLSRAWSVGLTAEGHIRNQDFFDGYTSRALINTTDTNAVFAPYTGTTSSYELTYTHIGLRFRGGLSYETYRHHLGLTISSPLLSIHGDASLTTDISISNLRMDGTSFNLLANGRQTELPVKYREPFSFAAAYAYDYGHGQLSVTCSYFLPMDLYQVITPRNESFLRPDTGSNRALTSDLLKMVDERKAIFNIGLGISYYVNPDVMAFLFLQSDRSYATGREVTGFFPNITNTDSYHGQIGGNFKRKKLNLRAGLLFTYGRSKAYQQPVNFSNPNESNFIIGDAGLARGTYFNAGLMLAYIHNL